MKLNPIRRAKISKLLSIICITPLFIIINCRRRLCGQTLVNVMEEPHQLGQAGHHDEDDGGGVGPQGGHQGARVDGVLGQPHHLLHCPSFLSSSVLLDLQVLELWVNFDHE